LEMLDILGCWLKRRGYKFLRIDGSTKVDERQKLIDQYSNDDSILVFLLATRAGGQGINLTAANVAILHDLDYNPQQDRQAEARIHRHGQTREVTVYRMVAKDTVEEMMMEMAERKLKLDDDMSGTDTLSKDDVFELLQRNAALFLQKDGGLEAAKVAAKVEKIDDKDKKGKGIKKKRNWKDEAKKTPAKKDGEDGAGGAKTKKKGKAKAVAPMAVDGNVEEGGGGEAEAGKAEKEKAAEEAKAPVVDDASTIQSKEAATEVEEVEGTKAEGKTAGKKEGKKEVKKEGKKEKAVAKKGAKKTSKGGPVAAGSAAAAAAAMFAGKKKKTAYTNQLHAAMARL